MINFTNITAANNTLEIVQAINTEFMNGLFFTLALLAIGMIIFITVSARHMAKEAFLFTAFFISIIGGLLWLAGLVPFYVVLIALFLPMIAMFLYFLIN